MATDRYASPPATSPEENALFLDMLQEAPLAARVVGSIFYCLLLAGYAPLAIGAPWIFQSMQGLISPLLCSCDVLLLLLTGFVLGTIKNLSTVSGLPSAQITLAGTATMLLVMVWKPHISFLSISSLLGIIMVLEALCAGSFISLYIGYIHQYNSLNSQPDVMKCLYSPLQPSSTLECLRYHDGGRLSDQQMALLQYQRKILHFLSEEILLLQECLSKYERTNEGSTPQVDLAHILAARDQELRTLSAEMNQLQSELRLARSLIAERDLRDSACFYNKQSEENERLRTILGEWSTPAAKLERALEAERMPNLELQRNISTLRNQPRTSAEHTEQEGV